MTLADREREFDNQGQQTGEQNGKVDDILSMVDSDPYQSTSFYTNRNKFEQLQRAAILLSKSKMVPRHFQNEMSDCFVALELAQRMGCSVFMLMQNMFVVHGKPGFEAKFVIAQVNYLANKGVGPFTAPIRWTFDDDKNPTSCTAHATMRVTGLPVEETIDMDTVNAEGWLKKDGSKWRTIPKLMFRYRSASWLCRLNCPEVLMGMYTLDELEDMGTPSVAEIAESALDRESIQNSENKKPKETKKNATQPKEPAPTNGAKNQPRPNGNGKPKPGKNNHTPATTGAIEMLIDTARIAGYPATEPALVKVLQQEFGLTDIRTLKDMTLGEVQSIMDAIDATKGQGR